MKVELWQFRVTDLSTDEFETYNVYWHPHGQYRSPIQQFHAEFRDQVPIDYYEPIGARHITITKQRIMVHEEHPRGTLMQYKFAQAIPCQP